MAEDSSARRTKLAETNEGTSATATMKQIERKGGSAGSLRDEEAERTWRSKHERHG